MKKILSLILVTIMLMSALVSCSGGQGGNPFGGEEGKNPLEVMSGSDVAKLLLANQRLNAQLLKTEGDIFEKGVEVMNGLAEKARANLNAMSATNNAPTVKKLASVQNTSTVLEGDYSGRVEIDGDTVTWSGFEENNNSYDAFKSTTENIVLSAEMAADLIDNIKKNVRVVDKWIDMGIYQYYLSVSENSEILCQRDPIAGSFEVCRRYRNEAGKDVYEFYFKAENVEQRMFYIPGERYEFSIINDHGEHMEDYFVADNSKGYWETYTVGALSTHYNVSYFIMKNDICYDAFYDPKSQSIALLKVMSADKATDIMNLMEGGDSSWVDIKFSGFDGIESVEANLKDVEYMEDGIPPMANYPGAGDARVYLTNGKVLHEGDTFVDGKVTLSGVHVVYSGGFGYIGEVSLAVNGETYEGRLANIKAFLNETGLQCRRDIDSVFDGIDRAYADLESVVAYYTWHGVSVIDEAGIGEAIVKENARMADMADLYTQVKDAEVLALEDTESIHLNIKFAPITQSSFDAVTLDTMKVSVGSMSLTIEDTTLYVKDEPYHVALALADAEGGLVHLAQSEVSSTKYADEDVFTVTAQAVECTLTALSAGSYTLVAYIATSDGVRASAYTPVAVTEIKGMPVMVDNMSVTAVKGEGDALVLTCSQEMDFTIQLTTPEKVGYEAFKAVVFEKIFAYGIPSDVIEMQSGDTYTALTGNETEIADGVYRIAYTIENGNSIKQGYVLVQYTCP